MIFNRLAFKVFTVRIPNGPPIFAQGHHHLVVVAGEVPSHVIDVPS